MYLWNHPKDPQQGTGSTNPSPKSFLLCCNLFPPHISITVVQASLAEDWSVCIVEAVGIPAPYNHLGIDGISLKASEIKQSHTAGLFCRKSEILDLNFRLVFPRADLLFVRWLVVELMEARSETADRPKKKKMKAFSMHKILFGILKNRLKQKKLAKLRRCVRLVH